MEAMDGEAGFVDVYSEVRPWCFQGIGASYDPDHCENKTDKCVVTLQSLLQMRIVVGFSGSCVHVLCWQNSLHFFIHSLKQMKTKHILDV